MTNRPTKPTPRRSLIGLDLGKVLPPAAKEVIAHRRTARRRRHGGGHLIKAHKGYEFQPTKVPFPKRRARNRRRDKIAAASRRRNRPQR